MFSILIVIFIHRNKHLAHLNKVQRIPENNFKRLDVITNKETNNVDDVKLRFQPLVISFNTQFKIKSYHTITKK